MAFWRCRACTCVYSDTMEGGYRYAHVCPPVHPAHHLASTTVMPGPGERRMVVKGARDESLVMPPGPAVDYAIERKPATIRDEGMGRDQVSDLLGTPMPGKQ